MKKLSLVALAILSCFSARLSAVDAAEVFSLREQGFAATRGFTGRSEKDLPTTLADAQKMRAKLFNRQNELAVLAYASKLAAADRHPALSAEVVQATEVAYIAGTQVPCATTTPKGRLTVKVATSWYEKGGKIVIVRVIPPVANNDLYSAYAEKEADNVTVLGAEMPPARALPKATYKDFLNGAELSALWDIWDRDTYCIPLLRKQYNKLPMLPEPQDGSSMVAMSTVLSSSLDRVDKDMGAGWGAKLFVVSQAPTSTPYTLAPATDVDASYARLATSVSAVAAQYVAIPGIESRTDAWVRKAAETDADIGVMYVSHMTYKALHEAFIRGGYREAIYKMVPVVSIDHVSYKD